MYWTSNILIYKIMSLEEFVSGFADQFDDTDPEEIRAGTLFHDLEEWSSLTGMAVIAFVKTAMGKKIEGGELKKCATVEDVYNLVNSK